MLKASRKTKLCPVCGKIETSARRDACTQCTPPSELDRLRSKVKAQAELLARAKELIEVSAEFEGYYASERPNSEDQWLAELKKFQSEEVGEKT